MFDDPITKLEDRWAWEFSARYNRGSNCS